MNASTLGIDSDRSHMLSSTSAGIKSLGEGVLEGWTFDVALLGTACEEDLVSSMLS